MSEYLVINDNNLLTRQGLHIKSYTIGAAQPDIKLIDVPGRPGKLDATLALNGRVNYTTRSISVTLHTMHAGFEFWHTMISELQGLFNGKMDKLLFSFDPYYYYKGRFTVDFKKSDPVTGEITIACKNAFPYKIDASRVTSDWVFDPTDFTTPQSVDHTIMTSGSVTCHGMEYNGTVTIYASAVMSVTWNGTTYQLAIGRNRMPEIHFNEGDNTLTFTGSGTVRIEYERGIQ